MTRAAFFSNNPDNLEQVYGQGRRERLAELCHLHPEVIASENIEAQLPTLADLEVIFSTWGMFALSEDQLAQLPQLKALFYAAGSVKNFAEPFLQRGITVFSGWGANAVPVAEFTLAQILLANKGYFRNIRDCARPQTRVHAFRGIGNFSEKVALLGAGMVGKQVIELLRPFQLEVVIFDPFLSGESAAQLGVEKVSLEEAFQRGMVVSNHVADLPQTRGMLQRQHFASMRPNAVFINTARGATVVEDDLVAVLQQRPDLIALLDVTFPEPPEEDSAFYDLPNVFLSSHLAGSINGEVVRMADTMIEEFLAWREGKPLRYAVSLDMIEAMA